jgi:hypothetical protein
MRETTAYESEAGNLHKSMEDCAAEDLTAFSKPDGLNAEQIGRDQAMKLVKNRKKVIRLLSEIDAPRAEPHS